MAQELCDTSDSVRDTGGSVCYTAHGRGLGRDTIFCILTGGSDDMAAYARDTACDTAGARCDTAGHSHDTAPVRVTTRCLASSVRAATQLGSGCAHCTLDSVLTKCTVLSHCSRGFQKIK